MNSLKSLRKLSAILLLVPILALLAVGIINFYVCLMGDRFFTTEQGVQPAPAIVVPGAGIRGDRPSPMLRDRLDTAAGLYRQGASPRILVSGDNSRHNYNEVQVMKNYLLESGIPEEAVYMDHAGFDTWSTMYRARDVFLLDSLIVVTQKYHLYRALYQADSLGLQVQGVPCDRYLPATPGYLIRESLARVKAFFYAELLRPAPRYLGDPVDMFP